MGSLDVGEPTGTTRLGVTFTVQLITNVRDDYLRRMIGDAVSDYVQGLFRGWTASGADDSPRRFVHFHSLIGPVLRSHDHNWAEVGTRLLPVSADEEREYLATIETLRPAVQLADDYERIDDPYDMESSGRYEEQPRESRPIE